jgi:hypothetical protein
VYNDRKPLLDMPDVLVEGTAQKRQTIVISRIEDNL